jgi:acyl carrier protein
MCRALCDTIIARLARFLIQPPIPAQRRAPYLVGLYDILMPKMDNMASVKEQLKPIILKSLRITDLTPDDLRDDQPLLGGDLEIDSIDILQLVLEIERHFGIKLVHAKFDQSHLESVDALAAIIESKVAAAKT